MNLRYCMAQKNICSICKKVIKKVEKLDKTMYYCEKNSTPHTSVTICENFACNTLTKCVKCYFCDYMKENSMLK